MNKELESKNIAADLCKLALLLNTYELCNDVSPLDKAGQSFIYIDSSNWKYELQKLTFTDANEVGGRMPSDASEISISLSLKIEGSHANGEENELSNPLSELAFDLEIDSQRINPTTYTIDDLYSCWHLDLHIAKIGDGDTKYSHPLYHFAFGGHKMETKGDLFCGNVLIMPSPRLMYPPMDAVLGIDFILQNYFDKTKITPLLADPEYIQIVQNSQLRLWKPFFTSLYSHWNNLDLNINDTFIHKKLFPFYC